ncbi:MAG: 2-C-methyl-D-erythritol 2,4-cyclodiphosphate synthase, 2-C-methyl-D-erythritol 4-phosphate cytidylyltransferase [Candidatus Peregrinibacteria bacterium GW2011_GWA2_33_10]|nr:MAG: 2-C-methyl-D-erythritol 2,4-cyclodiphosphate synthase, 2-C-methyl-D-erythritol 4-phosphate cytidylyltransferase [Candidatus Peregrinibacteria bacterium GW2011_GWA2_33_10]KKP41041.1 MAG: hypothetical protein UR30_C0002G0075 [Candidatus Peregrinibacteria bacterium GW2011_GWC2_33_13]
MNFAIIVAAGQSTRFKLNINKCFFKLNEKELISHILAKFENSELIDHIVVVIRNEDKNHLKSIIKENSFKKITKIVLGGQERQDSVWNGLKSLKNSGIKSTDPVIIHNGANPFFTEKELKNSIMAAKKFGASGVAHKAKDTIKVVDKNKFVKETLSRDFVVLMQTPQVIQYQLLINAYKKAMKEKFIGTDDLSLVERLGGKVKIIPASKDNFKITNFSDIQLGENILKNDLIRTGIGVDSHEFDKNKFGLILGGVKFNQYRSMKANSDGDVILHSLFNAISSASGQGSISEIADEMCLIKGIKDSREYLEVLLDKNKIIFLNISVALECKIPLITPISDKIKKSLSKILDLDIQNIGITATSGENMGPFGEGKGIRCISMVLFKIGPNRSLKI